MSKKTKTYDKPMKGESAKSFKKFKIYDNLSPGERTLEKVAEIVLEEEGVKKSDENYNTKLKKLISSLGNTIHLYIINIPDVEYWNTKIIFTSKTTLKIVPK